MISIRLITGDVNFNHLVRWCLPGFSVVKLLLTPLQLISILWGGTLRQCKYSFLSTFAH